MAEKVKFVCYSSTSPMYLFHQAEALVQALVILVLSRQSDCANPAERSEAVIWEPDRSLEKAEECLKYTNSQAATA